MLSPLPVCRAELIHKEITTKGSSPLLVLADDGNTYIAKTTTYQRVPLHELINEVLCGYFASCWGLLVPPMALVRISQTLADAHRKETGALSDRYSRCDFDNRLFFASRQLDCPVELEEYFRGPATKAQSKQWRNPVDFFKIGTFDLWIGNYDRKPENPNILIADRGEGTFDFCPIDHTAAFGHQSNYLEVREVMLRLESKKCILSHPLVRTIAKFVPPQEINDLPNNILAGIEVVLEHLDFIFDQVPREWGFSKKARAHLKKVLNDPDRNKRIATAYQQYL
jgi:hypothetical protein